eukprot:4155584-Prymnesium_polylepis.1
MRRGARRAGACWSHTPSACCRVGFAGGGAIRDAPYRWAMCQCLLEVSKTGSREGWAREARVGRGNGAVMISVRRA